MKAIQQHNRAILIKAAELLRPLPVATAKSNAVARLQKQNARLPQQESRVYIPVSFASSHFNAATGKSFKKCLSAVRRFPPNR